MTDRAHLVVAAGMILTLPVPSHQLQCAATARQTGQRCRNRVEPRQTCAYTILADGRQAYDADHPPSGLRPTDQSPAVRFVQQRCYVHLRHDAADAVVHEWAASEFITDAESLLPR
jgi:hypothetical protein